ncbi:subtilase family protein [Arthrobacter sp. JUb115]|nr:subtilase family protein [Arthrobacter sp. JUb115]
MIWVIASALLICSCASSSRSDNLIEIAVIDSHLPDGTAYECFNIEHQSISNEPVVNSGTAVHHAEVTLSHLLELTAETCPDWSSRVRIRHVQLSGEVSASSRELTEAITSLSDSSVDLTVIALTSGTSSRSLEDAIQELVDTGAPILAASGNRPGMSPGFPARFDGVLSIGALDNSQKPASFSAQKNVDVFLSGENIPYVTSSGDIDSSSGTSVATAIAANQILKGILAGKTPSEGIAELIQQNRRIE